MNYIIKRIIIGTGIALALMFLTKTFSLSVYASESETLIPTALRMNYKNNNGDPTNANYDIATINYNSYPNTPFYGKTSTGNGIQINQLRFTYSLTGLSDGYYDIDFLFNISYMNSKEPPTFMVFNNSHFYTCSSRDSFIFSYTTGYEPGQLTPVGPELPRFWAVSCDNVYLKPSANSAFYSLVYFDDSNANMGTGYGVSATTFQLNSSSKIEQNQQTIIDQQQEQIETQQETNDILNDDDTSDAEDSASDFFSGFSSTDHGGLSGIITTPLTYIQSMASGTCQPIQIQMPFMSDRAELPCVSGMVMSAGGTFGGYNLLKLYRNITTGIIAYWVLIRIFAHIRSFKKPDEDKVEVLSL